MTGKRSDNGQLRNEDLLIRNQSDNCIRERKVEIVLVSPIRRADCSKMDSLFLRLAFNLTGSLVQLASIVLAAEVNLRLHFECCLFC